MEIIRIVGNFEVGIYFRDLGAHCYPRHYSVQGMLGAPDVSVHYHFGTRHFGTYSVRHIVTSGYAQFGT